MYFTVSSGIDCGFSASRMIVVVTVLTVVIFAWKFGFGLEQICVLRIRGRIRNVKFSKYQGRDASLIYVIEVTLDMVSIG